MANRQLRYSNEDILAAIPGTGGLFSLIANRIGCSRSLIQKRLARSPTLRQAYNDECEKMLDVAESKLLAAIQAGDMGMVCFYLRTKGKNRGYAPRQELTGSDGEAINVKNVDALSDAERLAAIAAMFNRVSKETAGSISEGADQPISEVRAEGDGG